MNFLFNIPAMHWLQGCIAAAIGAFVLYLIAELVGALLILVAVLSLLFAAMAFVKQTFFRAELNARGEEAE